MSVISCECHTTTNVHRNKMMESTKTKKLNNNNNNNNNNKTAQTQQQQQQQASTRKTITNMWWSDCMKYQDRDLVQNTLEYKTVHIKSLKRSHLFPTEAKHHVRIHQLLIFLLGNKLNITNEAGYNGGFLAFQRDAEFLLSRKKSLDILH